MNKLILFLCIFLFYIFFSNFSISYAQKTVVNNEEEVVLTVTGMRCVGCEFGVERELRKLNGVVSVKADSSKNTVTVKFKKDIIKLDKIVDKINELGYRAEKPTK